MNKKLKRKLRAAIEKYICEIVDFDERMDTLFTDDLVKNMTDAAEVVYDQNVGTQKWLERNGWVK